MREGGLRAQVSGRALHTACSPLLTLRPRTPPSPCCSYSGNFIKLRAWNLTRYSALLLVDADVAVTGPLSPLFSLPVEFAGSWDQTRPFGRCGLRLGTGAACCRCGAPCVSWRGAAAAAALLHPRGPPCPCPCPQVQHAAQAGHQRRRAAAAPLRCRGRAHASAAAGPAAPALLARRRRAGLPQVSLGWGRRGWRRVAPAVRLAVRPKSLAPDLPPSSCLVFPSPPHTAGTSATP